MQQAIASGQLAIRGAADLLSMLSHPYPAAPPLGPGHPQGHPGSTTNTANGPAPFMKTFVLNDQGWLGEENPSPQREPVHREPEWRLPEAPAATVAASAARRLTDAVLRGDLQGLSALLNEPATIAQINAEDGAGKSALDHALDRKDFRAARLLVRHGARFIDDHLLQPKLLVNLINANELEFAKEVANYRQRVKANYHLPHDHQMMQSALFMSIIAGDAELAVLLVPGGQIFELRDPLGGGVLHYGAISANPLMLPSLLARMPADLQPRRAILNAARNDGRTPLIQAVLSNRPTALAALLRAGAGVDLSDRKGDTALHKAAREGMLDIGRLLLARDARVDLENRERQTPMALARQYGRPDFVQLLQSFGARA